MVPKFRAFVDNIMHYPGYEEWWFIGDSRYWSLNDNEDVIICDTLDGENPNLMMSTTLKDSKLNEIYEGDILSPIIINGVVTNGVVEFLNGCFIVRQDAGEKFFCCLNEINLNYTIIIGNIFEGIKDD